MLCYAQCTMQRKYISARMEYSIASFITALDATTITVPSRYDALYEYESWLMMTLHLVTALFTTPRWNVLGSIEL